MIKPPITRVWHGVDVLLGLVAIKQQPTHFNVLRLAFALLGLVGNVVISESQKNKKEIVIDGVRWRRID